ncbi:UDP-glucuronosyltransferase 2A3-like [Babylonia areolata]|uniref:UDP-glucuronosyltransferase 2A3-like n=1 Tax=Babylonia areolata TaxID=304850 RepID=UPI003FD07B1D
MEKKWWTVWIVTLLMPMLPLHDLLLEAKRVVFIPAPVGTSHSIDHVKIARTLQTQGHEVWVVVVDYVLERGVLDTSNITTIPCKMSENHEAVAVKTVVDGYFAGKTNDENMRSVLPLILKMCDEMLWNRELEEMIRDIQPDLIVLDSVPLSYTLAVLPYKFQVPFAMLGTVYDAHAMRMPISSAVNPLQIGFASSDNMTFFERVGNMFIHVILHVFNPFMPRGVASTHAPEMPYISNSDLLARAEVWLVEMDHILDYPRPTLPNVKLIGGTVIEHAKPLPPELQAFMGSATRGVVVVTFGSSVLGVPKHISDKLFHIFQKLPYKVVFRSNLTSPHPAKVVTMKWLPQNDLLGHPNTKVFVSHCGNNGQYEALFHAVPLLCTPIFAEQHYNSERILRKGFGEVVDLRTVSQEELLNRILTVAQEPGYKQAISKASTLFRQQYGMPMQEAAKWLDHVMQYGGEYMRYAGQKMPLYRFLALDVFAFVFGLCALSCALICCSVKMVCWCRVRGKTKTD